MKRAYLGHDDTKAQRELRIGRTHSGDFGQVLLIGRLLRTLFLISGGFLVVLGPQRQKLPRVKFLVLTELAIGGIVLVGSDSCLSLQWVL